MLLDGLPNPSLEFGLRRGVRAIAGIRGDRTERTTSCATHDFAPPRVHRVGNGLAGSQVQPHRRLVPAQHKRRHSQLGRQALPILLVGRVLPVGNEIHQGRVAGQSLSDRVGRQVEGFRGGAVDTALGGDLLFEFLFLRLQIAVLLEASGLVSAGGDLRIQRGHPAAGLLKVVEQRLQFGLIT